MRKITMTILLNNDFEPVSVVANHDLTEQERMGLLESMAQSEVVARQFDDAFSDSIAHPNVVQLIR